MHIVIDDHILSTFAALASIIDPTKCIGHADKHTWALKDFGLKEIFEATFHGLDYFQLVFFSSK